MNFQADFLERTGPHTTKVVAASEISRLWDLSVDASVSVGRFALCPDVEKIGFRNSSEGSVRFCSVRFGSVRCGSVRFGSVRFGSFRKTFSFFSVPHRVFITGERLNRYYTGQVSFVEMLMLSWTDLRRWLGAVVLLPFLLQYLFSPDKGVSFGWNYLGKENTCWFNSEFSCSTGTSYVGDCFIYFLLYVCMYRYVFMYLCIYVCTAGGPI